MVDIDNDFFEELHVAKGDGNLPPTKLITTNERMETFTMTTKPNAKQIEELKAVLPADVFEIFNSAIQQVTAPTPDQVHAEQAQEASIQDINKCLQYLAKHDPEYVDAAIPDQDERPAHADR